MVITVHIVSQQPGTPRYKDLGLMATPKHSYAHAEASCREQQPAGTWLTTVDHKRIGIMYILRRSCSS